MIVQADARRIPLRDGCVQCVVTSPPYFGLRDYGTARWESGDPACDHAPYVKPRTDRPRNGLTGGLDYMAAKDPAFRDICGKCGARRIDQQIGLEPSPDAYVAQLVAVFREVRRVLKDDGTVWLNLGDSYAGGGNYRGVNEATLSDKQRSNRGAHGQLAIGRNTAPPALRIEGLKSKDLVGIPWRVAFALQADGWYLRSDIIWCLSGGTRVYARTQKGDMPTTIKDLVRLDPSTVKLWNGEKWTQVLGWSETPRPTETYEIELRTGERIGCTAGHLWPTHRGNVRADALKLGDVVLTCELPEPEAPTAPASLEDVAVGRFVGLYLAEGSRSNDTIQIASHRAESRRFDELRAVARAYHGTVAVHQTSANGCTANLNGPVLNAIIDTYIDGRTAKDKHLTTRCWQRSDAFLRAVLDGYLEADGHFDAANNRWRLGFCQNDALASDLRTLCARLGVSLRLKRTLHQCAGKTFPGYRGQIRFAVSEHHSTKPDGEIVAIRRSRARKFWDIGVEDEPHLFALASGVLTHNSKPNPMPESVTDRPTKAHEYVFLLSKNERYFFDADAVREPSSDTGNGGWQLRRARGEPAPKLHEKAVGPQDRRGHSQWERGEWGFGVNPAGRNIRSVWSIATQPYAGAHFATMPEKLAERCILAGSRPGDLVLDPFGGSGTTVRVARRFNRRGVMLDLNLSYLALAEERTSHVQASLLHVQEQTA